MPSTKNQIYIKCVVKDTHGDVVEVVTIDGQRFDLDRLINRIRFNEIIVFAGTITSADDHVHKIVPKEIGRRRTLRSIEDETFRLENMPECNEDK